METNSQMELDEFPDMPLLNSNYTGSFDLKAIRKRMAFRGQDDMRGRMQSCIRFTSLAIFALVLSRSTQAQDSDISGSVRDAAGQPLAGVLVLARHHGPGDDEPRTKTDAQGRFELKSVGQVVFFTAPKLQPVTFVRSPQQSSFETTMQSDLVDHWPATCSSINEPGRRYGWPFRFLVPRGAKVRKQTSTDVTSWTINFPHRRNNEHLVLTAGPLLGDGFAPEEWILKSEEFSERNSAGLDWRGTTKDGKWRWFSSSQTVVSYSNASDQAGLYFDRIIDSVCVSPPGKM